MAQGKEHSKERIVAEMNEAKRNQIGIAIGGGISVFLIMIAFSSEELVEKAHSEGVYELLVFLSVLVVALCFIGAFYFESKYKKLKEML